MKRFFLVYLCCATCVLSANKKSTAPRIIIVGAGVAGIAAASKLFENGFTNVLIFEAEKRIGGRIHSVQLGNYMADLGAQWIGGEEGNVVFELAWPLGLLERSNDTYEWSVSTYGSSGSSLPDDISYDLSEFADTFVEEMQQSDVDALKTGSLGEYADAKFKKYMKSHPRINKNLYNPLHEALNMRRMSSDAADSWYDVSAKSILNYPDCQGDSGIHWKDRTWSTILDILMRKVPDPSRELPILRNTVMSNKIITIDYTGGPKSIKVLTENGKDYLANHVIFTGSLGVLKANHQYLFRPPLSSTKLRAIQNIGFGRGAKIIVYNKHPWWHHEGNELNQKMIFWTNEDRREMKKNPSTRWMLGINTVIPVEYKPQLLNIWVSSKHAIEMESIPDKLFHSQVSQFLRKFFAHEYNVTELTALKRSMWNTNKNFRGVHSYRGLKADTSKVENEDLATPIMHANAPVLLFAGEATVSNYGTVHGAIESGWREADRLINYYKAPNQANVFHGHFK